MRRIIVAVGLALAVGAVAAAPSSQPTSQPTTQRDIDLHPQRTVFLDRLKKAGIITDVRVANHVGKLVVTSSFMAIDFDAKQKFVGVAYKWCTDEDPECRLLVVKESVNDKQVGRFSPESGLKMD